MYSDCHGPVMVQKCLFSFASQLRHLSRDFSDGRSPDPASFTCQGLTSLAVSEFTHFCQGYTQPLGMQIELSGIHGGFLHDLRVARDIRDTGDPAAYFACATVKMGAP